MTPLQILHPERRPRRIEAAIFDFDGTFSTLRCGWEKVMQPLMLEMISGKPAEEADEALIREVDDYISASTGIQTVYQMQWLKQRAEQQGTAVSGRDEWWYKGEYNRRLMEKIRNRIESLENNTVPPETYLIKGSVEFVKRLKDCGISVYLASGTDHGDVCHEAHALRVDSLFSEIHGAPENKAACSKEAVIKMLMEEKKISGENLLLVGDGKVEIQLGVQAGAFTLGAATNEEALCGINPVKYDRLVKAGADAIVGDFEDIASLSEYLRL